MSNIFGENIRCHFSQVESRVKHSHHSSSLNQVELSFKKTTVGKAPLGKDYFSQTFDPELRRVVR